MDNLREDSLRAFIGAKLDFSLEEYIVYIENNLKKINMDVKWVEPQNIHLTLKFLGNIHRKDIPSIQEIIENVFRERKAIKVRLTSLGAFPHIHRPRAIWIGLKSYNDCLERKIPFLENEFCKLGFSKEKREFKSHITLGRVRKVISTDTLAKFIEEFPVEKKEGFIEKVSLFKSTLTSCGPIYEVLYSVILEK